MDISKLKLGDKLAFDGTMVVTAVTFNPNKVQVCLQEFAAATSIWITEEEANSTKLVVDPPKPGDWLRIEGETILRQVTRIVNDNVLQVTDITPDGSHNVSVDKVSMVNIQTDPFV